MITQTQQEINEASKRLNKTVKIREVFDPRIIDPETNSGLWSSESVELALNGLAEGYKLKDNPFLKSVKGFNLRKHNLPFKYSDEEMKIMHICAKDKEFFCDNFGKLKDGDQGWQKIDLYNYQRNLLKRYTDNRWNIVMFPRQAGKTTTTVLEILHYAIWNIDKDMVVIAQSDKVVNEILAKIKEAFAGLPFFMQPGFISFNKKGFTLDNGCRLTIGIAAESVVQGFALDFLYIDEFAYIKQSLVDKFWNNIYPSLSKNPNSKCIITSTPNGRNKFHGLWVGAETKANKFIPYRIYWYDTPGRDEQFKIDTIANIGIEGWEMGFECSFDTQLKSIFNSKVQIKLRGLQNDHEHQWSMDNNPIGNKFGIDFISQDIVKYDLKKDWFLLGIDLGEGLGQDNTVIKIKKIEWDIPEQKLKFKSIGIFKNNDIAVEDFAEMNLDLIKEFDSRKIQLIVENNTYGGEYFAQIDSLRINNSEYFYSDNSVFAQFHREAKNGFERGIRWNNHNKKLGVKSFSGLVEKDTLVETHYMSVEEYLNFGKQKSGTYAAQYGNDDLVMADVSISHFIRTNNVFSIAFLNACKAELRLLCNDEDQEIKKRKEEEQRKADAVYKYNGFNLRNHAECLSKGPEEIFMFEC